MQIRLTNTLTRAKETFAPADPARVTMYVCGSTVYNHPHIGNARPAVVFDVLFGLLRAEYGEAAVLYASNFTDIDDKIIRAAADAGVAINAISDKFARIYREDMAALGVLTPTHEPRATEHVGGMIALIEKLIAQGAAYKVASGVYFSVAADSDYGKLSRRAQEDMQAGARVEGEDDKRHSSDFALWKASKPGEPTWNAPFGAGRPGWHIECSAMIAAQFGETIDIHGGGLDLVFPHHENEIAQSESANHAPLARVWMHNGMLNMAREKMSKSIGNIVTVRELLEQGWQGETIRWALLSAHYRAPLDWSEDLLRQAWVSLIRIYQTLQEANELLSGYKSELDSQFEEQAYIAHRERELTAFYSALHDDLNTPLAFRELWAMRDRLKSWLLVARTRRGDYLVIDHARRALLEAGGMLGLLQEEPQSWLQAGTTADVAQIERLVAIRVEARKANEYEEADRIRDQLSLLGVEVMDGPSGSTWRRKG